MFGKIGTAIAGHKVLAIIVAVVFGASAIGGAIVFVHDTTSKTSISSTEAKFSLETTVVGLKTNATDTNSLYIGSNWYTSANISDFKITTTSSLQSSISVPVNNMVLGQYVYFGITVKNTGTAAVNLTSYSASLYYYNATTGAALPYTGTPSPNQNGTEEQATVNGYSNPTLNDVFISNMTFATNPSNTVNYGENPSFGLDSFNQSYSYFNTSTYNTQWFQDNSANVSALGNSHVMTGENPVVMPGQLFTWYDFYGLGSQSPLNLPPAYNNITLDFEPAA